MTGQVTVTFPKIGIPGGVVHVTASSNNPEWCQVQSWKPTASSDEEVIVQCSKFGGVRVFIPFSIVFEHSSGTLPAPKAFGYVHYDGSSIVTQFNSASGVNTVVPGGSGTWTVTLPGLGSSAPSGNLQVTAVDPKQAARCKVSGWSSAPAAQYVEVRCHDATTSPLKTGWTLTYHNERAITGMAPKDFAYTLDTDPTKTGPYTPPGAVDFSSQFSSNTIQNFGVGRRVVFPKVGFLPDDLQVTAYSSGAEYCNMSTLWSTTAGEARVDAVNCYDGVTLVHRRFFATYVSAG